VVDAVAGRLAEAAVPDANVFVRGGAGEMPSSGGGPFFACVYAYPSTPAWGLNASMGKYTKGKNKLHPPRLSRRAREPASSWSKTRLTFRGAAALVMR
jgi:hypothetical protein